MPQKSIEEVKEAWEKKLMATEGVTAIGISLSKDRVNPCIKVFVTSEKAAASIPKDLDGYPVEVVRRSSFQAL